ncbi:MAG: sensor histidine kinase [Phycisphaerales bacterium]
MSSLRRAIVVRTLCGAAAALVVSGVATFAITRAVLRARFDADLAARAHTFASLAIEEPHGPGEPGGIKLEYLGPLREEDIGIILRVTTGDGHMVAQTPGNIVLESQAPALDAGPAFLELVLPDGRRVRCATIARLAARDPEDTHDEPQAVDPARTVVVQAARGTEAIRRTESLLGAVLSGGVIVALVGTATAVMVGVRRGLQPLERLSRELAGVDPADPSRISGAEAYPDELRPVVGTLDEALERLRGAMERERRFTDAAAHELRTPIAELRAIVDVARRWPEASRSERVVVQAGAVAEEMGALLEVLLAAARGTEAFANHPAEAVAIMPLARELAGRAPTIAWTIEGDEGATWVGPRAAIGVIVRNIIQNVADHTTNASGSASVRVSRCGLGTILEVENGPVELREADAARVFEPLWRGEASRTDRSHRGMGLYLVAELCRSLGLRACARVAGDRFVIDVVPAVDHDEAS